MRSVLIGSLASAIFLFVAPASAQPAGDAIWRVSPFIVQVEGSAAVDREFTVLVPGNGRGGTVTITGLARIERITLRVSAYSGGFRFNTSGEPQITRIGSCDVSITVNGFAPISRSGDRYTASGTYGPGQAAFNCGGALSWYSISGRFVAETSTQPTPLPLPPTPPPSAPPPTITYVDPQKGTTAGGRNVSIFGSNFRPGATVTFGGQPAKGVVWIRSTELTAVTPARAAGVVDVVVRNPDGQAATSTNGYRYVAPPTITEVVPMQGDVAGGEFIAIKGTAFEDGALVSLGGSLVVETKFVSATLLTAITPRARAAGTVDVRVSTRDDAFTGLTGTKERAYTYVDATSKTFALVVTKAGTGTGAITSAPAGITCRADCSTTSAQFTMGQAVTLTATADAGSTFAGWNDTQCPGTGLCTVKTNATTRTVAATFNRAGAPRVTSISPASGPTVGGTPVTIRGSGFIAGARVNLSGIAIGNQVVRSDTVITGTTGSSSAGPATVIAQNPDGQAGELRDGFTYVEPPPEHSLPPSRRLTPAFTPSCTQSNLCVSREEGLRTMRGSVR